MSQPTLMQLLERAVVALEGLPAALNENTAVSEKILAFRQELAGEQEDPAPKSPGKPRVVVRAKEKPAEQEEEEKEEEKDEESDEITDEALVEAVQGYLSTTKLSKADARAAFAKMRAAFAVEAVDELTAEQRPDFLKKLAKLPMK